MSVLPTQRQRGTWRDDPMVPVIAERVGAVIDLSGLSVKEVAKRIGIAQQTLDHIVHQRQKRCRARHLGKLGAVLNVPPQWLSDARFVLSGVRQRWSDQELRFSGLVLDIRHRLDVWGRSRSHLGGRQRRLLVGAVETALDLIADKWGPPRVQGAPGAEVKLLQTRLGDLRGRLERRVLRRRACADYIEAIDDYLRIAPAQGIAQRRDMPARAQFAEYRLKQRCVVAWRRDVLADSPKLDPVRVPVSDRYDLESESGVLKEPWRSLGSILGAVETVLMPEVWRRCVLLDQRPEGQRTLTEADWDRTTSALAAAVERLLDPWFRGEARLDAMRLLKATSPLR